MDCPVLPDSRLPDKYYSDFDELTDLYSLSSSSISIFHFNVRSFAKNGSELLLFLSGLPSLPDVIVMSETWFGDDYVDMIGGYIGYHVFRQNRRGGGVSIFVNRKFRSRSITEQSFVEDDLEMCSVRITVGACEIVVIGVYRPPGKDVLKAIELLDPALQVVGNDQRAFLIGDVNIDSINPCPIGTEFINYCYSSSFFPLVSLPTHVSNTASTCIDHIYYNQLDAVNVGIFKTDLTDHYPIFAIVDICHDDLTLVSKKFRDHSDSSLNEMMDKLSFFINNFRNNTSGFNVKFNSFIDGIYDIYNECCPVRSKVMSVKRSLKPWISTALIRCINRKHSLFKKYKRNLISFERYNTYKNVLTSMIRRARERYYNNKFKSHAKDSKKTWNLVNSLVRSKEKSRIIEELDVDGSKITDPLEIATHFSNYFSNAAISLDRLVPAVENSALDYLDEARMMSMFVPPAADLEVKRVITELPSKSSDISQIPAFIFKYFSDLLSSPIADLFNESVTLGTFPERLKIARVVPVYKSGDRMIEKNYRPISTLPFLSKVFERLMYMRLMSYLNSNNLICAHQFGFRQNFSTSDAVVELVDSIYQSLDRKNIMLSIFLDLSKAFDTVNHDILIAKLSNIGIRGRVNDWFRSFISDRKQYVSIINCNSPVTMPIMGVPQGSTLGPILFLLYINDMSRCSNYFKFLHYADDTTLLLDSSNPDVLAESVNRELLNVKNWLCANRLSLNIGKTSYMVVSDRDVVVPNVCIGDMNIGKVEEAKFLGVTLDHRLSFVPHVERLSKQVSRATGILKRLSSLLPVPVRVKIYFALIYSRVNYGIVSWGKCNVASLDRLNRTIERAKKCLGCSADSRNKLMNLQSIYHYAVSDKMYRITKMKQHPYFEQMYLSLRPDHNHFTRFTCLCNYNIPMYCKSKCQRGYFFQSVRIWNSLPNHIREIDTLSQFRRCLKLYLRSGQE